MLALPPLPDRFGNPLVRDFNEIVPAADVDWLPQTMGWYLLGGFVAIATARRLTRSIRKWLRNRYRREALKRLAQMTAQSELSVTDINALLKTTAMVAASRAEVAALAGTDWTDWLVARAEPAEKVRLFTGYLGDRLYMNNALLPIAHDDTAKLLSAVRWWILHHRDDHGSA